MDDLDDFPQSYSLPNLPFDAQLGLHDLSDMGIEGGMSVDEDEVVIDRPFVAVRLSYFTPSVTTKEVCSIWHGHSTQLW